MPSARGSSRLLIKRGKELLQQGRLAEAHGAFLEICDRGSTDPEAWYLLGMINGRLGLLDRVEACLRQALRLRPDFSEAALRLGDSLAYLGKLPQALEVLHPLASNNPQLIEAWLKLGNVFEVGGNHAEAIRCYLHVTVIDPRHDDAYTHLGNAYHFIGDYDRAIGAYARATELNPANLRATLGRDLSLPIIYRDRAHMLSARRHFQEGLDKLLNQVERFKNSPRLIDDLQWCNNFYLAYQGLDDRPLQETFGHVFSMLVGHALPQFMAPIARTAAGDRRLRIGYASHFFHSHTVSTYFNNWILEGDRDRLETFVYHINPVVDMTSQRLATGCTHYRPVTGAIAGIADTIRNDQLDVLVYPEVGMYSKTMWLAALRLAPIQCAAWGHPVTTGLASIDYALSAEATEPMDGQQHYSESLIRLSGMGVCLSAPKAENPGTRQQFDLPGDRNLYLCSQSLFKIHVDMDELMVAVARHDPRALILLFEDYKPSVNEGFKQRTTLAFANNGLKFDDHLRLLPRMKHPDFLRINQLANVMLDTPHWSGGRTSLDALSVGLPIVALPGQYSRGRQTSGMLERLDLRELVARDRDEYVAKVTAIATDQRRRDSLSRQILERAPGRLFDAPDAVRSLEQFYFSL